ncbi:MAG: erythromycin esterase family protein [Pseudomonadota bacterium]
MTRNNRHHDLVSEIEKNLSPLQNQLQDYDEIVEAARDKDFVLLGEASHGTAEFYRARIEITQRLIFECGFDAVVVEADWPDAYRVNKYVCRTSNDQTADEALADFERFPSWMWRNTEVKDFITWLEKYNTTYRDPQKSPTQRDPIRFYGLDLYSLSNSLHAVIAYLDKIDPIAARAARQRYSCLDHFLDNPGSYGYATELGLSESCEDEVVAQLIELQRKALEYSHQNGTIGRENYFSAVQNAALVKKAEKYYRAMFRGRPNTWNLRDSHMFETLENIHDYLGQSLDRPARIVVWAHNSHIGNAAATGMADRGEYNIGQLVRQQYPDQSLLVGFSTCRGTVTAADNWDQPARFKRLNEPVPGSYEEVFHHVNEKAFLLDLRHETALTDMLSEPRLQRAVGVIYRPDTERQSHYFQSRLPEQFDFILHYDSTTALQPIETVIHPHYNELDETYPYGL